MNVIVSLCLLNMPEMGRFIGDMVHLSIWHKFCLLLLSQERIFP